MAHESEYDKTLSDVRRESKKKDQKIEQLEKTVSHLERALRAKDDATAIVWRSLLGPVERRIAK